MNMETKIEEPTLPEMAEEYVKLLNSPPNGWGQHIHPKYGNSHRMLLAMRNRFGLEETNKAIDAAFHELKTKAREYIKTL